MLPARTPYWSVTSSTSHCRKRVQRCLNLCRGVPVPQSPAQRVVFTKHLHLDSNALDLKIWIGTGRGIEDFHGRFKPLPFGDATGHADLDAGSFRRRSRINLDYGFV